MVNGSRTEALGRRVPLRISSCTATRIAGYSTRRPKDSGRGTALRPIAGRRTAHAGCLLRRNRGPVRPMLVAEASVRPSCPGTGDLGRSTVFDIRGVSVERRTREIGSMGLRSPRAAATSGQRRKSARTGRGGRGSAAGAPPGLPASAAVVAIGRPSTSTVVLDPRSPMDDRVSVRPCRARWRSSCRVSGRTGCRSTRLMTDYWNLLSLGVSA